MGTTHGQAVPTKGRVLMGGMLEGGVAVPDDASWWVVRRWVLSEVKRSGWTHQRLGGTAYVPVSRLNKFLGEHAEWLTARYLERLLEALPPPSSQAVAEALSQVLGRPVAWEQGLALHPSLRLVDAPLEPATLLEPVTLIVGKADLGLWLRFGIRESTDRLKAAAGAVGVPVSRVRRWLVGDFEWREFPGLGDLAAMASALEVEAPRVEFGAELDVGPMGGGEGLAGEIARWASRLAVLTFPPASADRNAMLFASRYVSMDRSEGTLQAVGDLLGLTRERIRQLIDRMLARADLLPAPRSMHDQLMAELGQRAPVSVDLAEVQFAGLLGGGMGIASALRFGEQVLGRPVTLEVRGRVGVGDVVMPVVGADWWPVARTLARAMVRVRGAALFDLVWALTSREAGVPVQDTDLQRALESVPGFEWLGDGGWFWFGAEGGSNNVITMAARIVGQSDERVDVEVIHAGIERRRRRFNKAHGGAVSLPMSVLTRLLAASPLFECLQGDDFRLVAGADVPDGDGEGDDEGEQETVAAAVVRRLVELGGVAARAELWESLVDTGLVGAVSLRVALSNSEQIIQVERGVFGVRGWALCTDRLIEAKRRVGGENEIQVSRDEAGGVSWTFWFTESLQSACTVNVPARARRLVPGGQYACTETGVAVVVADGRIRGLLTPIRAAGAVVGDAVRIRFEVATGKVWVNWVAPAAQGST